jgi:hypothetical protein
MFPVPKPSRHPTRVSNIEYVVEKSKAQCSGYTVQRKRHLVPRSTVSGGASVDPHRHLHRHMCWRYFHQRLNFPLSSAAGSAATAGGPGASAASATIFTGEFANVVPLPPAPPLEQFVLAPPRAPLPV